MAKYILLLIILCLLAGPDWAQAESKADLKVDFSQYLDASRARTRTVEGMVVKPLDEILATVIETQPAPGEPPHTKVSPESPDYSYTREHLRRNFKPRTEAGRQTSDKYRVLRKGEENYETQQEAPGTKEGIAQVWKAIMLGGGTSGMMPPGADVGREGGRAQPVWLKLKWDDEDNTWAYPTRKMIRAHLEERLHALAGRRAYQEYVFDRSRRSGLRLIKEMERAGKLGFKELGPTGVTFRAEAYLRSIKDCIPEHEKDAETCGLAHKAILEIDREIAEVLRYHAAWGGAAADRSIPAEARKPVISLAQEREYLKKIEKPIKELIKPVEKLRKDIDRQKEKFKWPDADTRGIRTTIRELQQKIAGYNEKLIPMQKDQARSAALVRAREIALADEYIAREKALKAMAGRETGHERAALDQLEKLLGYRVLEAARKGELKPLGAPAGSPAAPARTAASGKKQTVLVLKDGTRITGTIVATMPDQLSIMTAKRELVMVKLADIKERSETGAAPVKVDPQPAPGALPPGHEAFKMKDGTTVTGKVTIRTPDMIMLKTAAGKMVTLEVKDIAEE